MVLPLLAAQAAVTSIDALTGAVKGLKDRFDKAMEVADNAQKASLSLGKTYEEVRKDLKNSIGGLRGSIENKLQVGFNLLNSGLDKNSAGVAKLINQQQLTGTSFNNTAKTIAKLESSIGTSRDSSNKLAENIILLSYKFGISTDKLIDSLASLKETFTTQRAIGLGANFQEAIAIFVAKYGPAFAEDITNSVKYVLEPGIERAAQLQMLGLDGMRGILERVRDRKTPEELADFLEQGFKAAGKEALSLSQGSLMQLGILDSLLGPFRSLIPLATAQPRDPKTVEREKALSDFAKTIDTMRKETFNPLDELLMDKVYPAYAKLYEIFSASINVFFRAYNVYIDAITEGKALVDSDVFKKLKKALLDGAETVALFGSKVFTFITDGGLDLVSSIIDMIADGIQSTFGPGGYIDRFYVGMMGVVTSIKESLDFGFEDASTTQAKREQLQREVELSAKQKGLVFPDEEEVAEILNLRNKFFTGIKLTQEEMFKALVYSENYPQYVAALNDNLGDVFLKAAKVASEQSPLSKDFAKLQEAMEKDPMYIALKTYFEKLRENMSKDKSLLAEIDENTADTAKATQATAAVVTAQAPMTTALQTAGVSVLDSTLNAINTATNIQFDEEVKQSMKNFEQLQRELLDAFRKRVDSFANRPKRP